MQFGLSFEEHGEQILREIGLAFSHERIIRINQGLGGTCIAKKVSDSCNVVRQDALLSVLSEAWNNAVENGVNVRWLPEQSTNGSSIKEIATAAARNPHFSLRFLTDLPVPRLAVYDGHRAFIAVSSNSDGIETAALWTSNRIIVPLVAEYFEMKWKQGSEIRPLVATTIDS